MINPYDYIVQNDGVNFSFQKETSLCTHYKIDLPSAQPTRYLGNNRIIGEYFFPKNQEKAPLAILVHGMGDRSIIPCRMISKTLLKKGIASFILYLVFHRYRAPARIASKYPALTPEEWFESYQISVTDIRQVIDWAQRQNEIEQDNISAVGISFGGFISSIAMALDKRIKSSVLLVTGGNTDKISRNSLLLKRQYKYSESEHQQIQESYAKYLAEVEKYGFENVVAEQNSFLTDPMTFSSYLRSRPILMINALWDEMIPKVSTIDLWKACGSPVIKWYHATHASIWLWYPVIGPQIHRFLEKAFNKSPI